MLPEQIAYKLEEEDRRRIANKLDSALNTDYSNSGSRREVLLIISEIAELMYKKGRYDEKYYNYGPISSFYDDEP